MNDVERFKKIFNDTGVSYKIERYMGRTRIILCRKIIGYTYIYDFDKRGKYIQVIMR